MIPVIPSEEPAFFDERVRKRGNAWLASNPGTRDLPSYWTECRKELAAAFQQLCAYSAMLDYNGTIDHYHPRDTYRNLSYEWRNYRYATHWVNSGKKNREFLDPFDVKEGWFEIVIPSMLLVMTEKVPPDVRARIDGAKGMLKWLNGERFKDLRWCWYEQYKSGVLPLEGLRRYAPMVAAAVERMFLANGQQ